MREPKQPLHEPTSERAYLRKRRIVSLISLILVIALFTLIAFTVGTKLLHFIGDTERFRAWVDSQGLWGRLALIGIMVMQVVIALMPGEIVEIGAGLAFGAIQGTVLCLIGTAIGSAVIFLFTKRFGIKMVEAFIPREKINSLKFIQDSQRLDLLVFILFFIPGTPKDVITYFIGLTPMKLKTFLLITTFARIPSVITSTIGGDALGGESYVLAVIMFVATALLSGVGLLVYRHISRSHQSKKNISDCGGCD